MILVFIILFAVIINRLFNLQIINGESYVDNLSDSIKKTTSVEATRGRIFDRNGVLLAYNDLAYSVKISDSGTYSSNDVKNATINEAINKTINIIESNGDQITNDFPIVLDEDGNLEYNIEDNTLLRFLRDIYGAKSVNDLTDEQKNTTAQQLFDYLCSDEKYNVSDEYPVANRLEILNLRRYMSANSYNRYMTFTISYEVSDATVAAILENSEELVGVTVEEEYIRRYVDSIYTAHILGYTGNVSSSELEDLQAQNDQYEANDTVGKSGIEQSLETELQGTKGSKTVYVDTVGRITEVVDQTDPSPGHDVYLTIDINLQKKVYQEIEDKIVEILLSKITDSDQTYTYKSDGSVNDIYIPIKNVYFALLDNNIVKLDKIAKADSGIQSQVYQTFLGKQSQVMDMVRSELTDSPTVYSSLGEEKQLYVDYIYSMLKTNGIINTDAIDTNDETYLNWQNSTISLEEFLTYAISQNWVDMSKLPTEQYTSLQESYNTIVDYVMDTIQTDSEFQKKIYKTLVQTGALSGRQICMMLYEQGVLDTSDADYASLNSGAMSAYSFMITKITNKEITPAQLALEPCSGSAVITNPQNGQVLAMVSYPSYDNNKLSGTVDASYYSQLRTDKSNPLINRATTAQTAPGSIFKPTSAIAGLEEGVISTGESIYCSGSFTQVTPPPKCWIYPSGHGAETVSTAIRDSCNVFFYTVGYRLAMDNGKYNSTKGTSILQNYAEQLGLATKSGVEIYEKEPQASNINAIPSAIGQGNHNYSAVNLARYVSTLATSGTNYKLTLIDKITDYDGNVISENEPEVTNVMDVSSTTWNAVSSGMKMVIQNTTAFSSLSSLNIAGKSGTAQESTKHPDHATFISYAPANNPEIAMSVVIQNGYSSARVGELTAEIYKDYYGLK